MPSFRFFGVKIDAVASCIFRLYAIESISFYRDVSFYLDLVVKFAGEDALKAYKV